MTNVNSMIDSIEKFEKNNAKNFEEITDWKYDSDTDSFSVNDRITVKMDERVKSNFIDFDFCCKLPFKVSYAYRYKAEPDYDYFDRLLNNEVHIRQVHISNPEFFPDMIDNLLNISTCIVDLNLVKTIPNPKRQLASYLYINEKSIPAFPLITSKEDFLDSLPENLRKFDEIIVMNYSSNLATTVAGYNRETKFFETKYDIGKHISFPLFVTIPNMDLTKPCDTKYISNVKELREFAIKYPKIIDNLKNV